MKFATLSALTVLGFVWISWGFFGHRTINQLAIYTVPMPLTAFLKAHAAYLSEHAVDPDRRRYSVPGEAERHYLDADHWEQALPLDTIPRRWKEALEKWGEDSLRAYGIGPWHLEQAVWRLQNAFSAKDQKAILRLCAEVGHYAADMCVPLHTTENYNGQLTGQKGIHGFWESRLPELFSARYDFYTGPAVYLENVNAAIWDCFEESVAARDSVLLIEKRLSLEFPDEQKYSFEEKGNGLVRVYSVAYSQAYHQQLNGMVERRMRRAVLLVGSLWYTAWVNAGSPKLEAGFTEKALPTDSIPVQAPLSDEHHGRITDLPE